MPASGQRGTQAMVTRRGMLGGTAMAAAVVAGPASAAIKTRKLLPRFGPAPGDAHLVYNENPYGPAPSALRAMADGAAQGCYYADDIEPQLIAMIASRHGVAPNQVVLGNGSSELLAAAHIVAGRKGPILAPALTFDEVLLLTAAQGIAFQSVPLAPDMGIDLVAMAAASGSAGLVYLCNPNNPTGLMLEPATLRGFIANVSPYSTVLVDEAYLELADNPEAHGLDDLVRSGANLILTRTFSKLHGLAGLRIGYALGPAPLIAAMKAARTTIGLSSAGLAAAIASYDDLDFVRYSRGRIIAARQILLGAAAKAGVRALPSQASFVLIEVPDANRLQAAMATRGIRIRSSYGPAFARWSRVSTGRIADVQRYADALPMLLGS
ncbi:histidinol-phosphate transaminase [Sandarakinorhabdus sp.]|uniref:pyridoxal phosphate-dependent aminotransferase n=1 Tax=Sandarakinorhabdus sp. TaxID=1916663 RepID=UPI00286D853C|nr:histidinol-phosphate transaminase [Sandarakinorhabdus sp.]